MIDLPNDLPLFCHRHPRQVAFQLDGNPTGFYDIPRLSLGSLAPMFHSTFKYGLDFCPAASLPT